MGNYKKKQLSNRKHTPEFKVRVVKEAIKRHSLTRVADKYDLYPGQISLWRKEYLAGKYTEQSLAVEKKTEKVDSRSIDVTAPIAVSCGFIVQVQALKLALTVSEKRIQALEARIKGLEHTVHGSAKWIVERKRRKESE